MSIPATDLEVEIRTKEDAEQFLDRWIESALDSIEEYTSIRPTEDSIRYQLEDKAWAYYAGKAKSGEDLVNMKDMWRTLGSIETKIIRAISPKPTMEEIKRQTTYALERFVGFVKAGQIVENKLFMKGVYAKMDGKEVTDINVQDALSEMIVQRCAFD